MEERGGKDKYMLRTARTGPEREGGREGGREDYNNPFFHLYVYLYSLLNRRWIGRRKGRKGRWPN